MLSIHHLDKSYGIQPILKDITFNISAGERVGLIGPNGCGKTTLMRILAGLERPDSGTVAATRPNLRIGYLAQGMDLAPGQTLQTALGLDPVSQSDPARDLESLAAALSANPSDSALQTRYDQVLLQLSTFHIQPETILGPLGLAHLPLDTPVQHISGGQKTRLMLVRILLQEPNLLLFDEPTNHLDIEMLEWLEEWLARFSGAALIVSHDRTFLDNTVTTILELDARTHTLRAYDGNYSDYARAKLRELEQQEQAYQDQQDELAQLRRAAAHIRGLAKMRKGGKADPQNTDGFSVGFFGNRATKNVVRRAKNIEARIEHILTEERVERPRGSYKLKLNFGALEHQSKDVLVTESLSIGYAPDEVLLENLNLSIRASQRIVLTGPNGAGKTSFIRTIADKIPPLAGSFRLGGSVKLGYMAQEQELLDPNLNAVQTIQKVSPTNEMDTRNYLHFFLFSGDDPLRPTRELSFGERARLQLAALVAQGCTFLILDEPINHLDIPSRERFEEALENFQGAILAVVHDRSFIQRFASEVWYANEGRIKVM